MPTTRTWPPRGTRVPASTTVRRRRRGRPGGRPPRGRNRVRATAEGSRRAPRGRHRTPPERRPPRDRAPAPSPPSPRRAETAYRARRPCGWNPAPAGSPRPRPRRGAPDVGHRERRRAGRRRPRPPPFPWCRPSSGARVPPPPGADGAARRAPRGRPLGVSGCSRPEATRGRSGARRSRSAAIRRPTRSSTPPPRARQVLGIGAPGQLPPTTSQAGIAALSFGNGRGAARPPPLPGSSRAASTKSR